MNNSGNSTSLSKKYENALRAVDFHITKGSIGKIFRAFEINLPNDRLSKRKTGIST